MGSSQRGRPSVAGLPPGFTLKRKTLADGTVAEYIYYRGGGRVNAKLGTPEFEAEVRRLTGRQETVVAEGTWGKLVEIYKASPEYRALTVKTRAYYDRHLNRVREFSAFPLNQIRRRDLLAIRDAIAIEHPQAANQFVMVLGVVFRLALDRELIEHDPIAKVRRIPGGTHKTWTDEQLHHALTNFAEPYRRAVVLASHLGQRESDLVKMVWSDFARPQMAGQQLRANYVKEDFRARAPCRPGVPRHPQSGGPALGRSGMHGSRNHGNHRP